MNYLAHIFLAQPSIESVCGNLMGDFMKGVRLDDQPPAIQQGVLNHRLVDRFTDEHPRTRSLRKLLSPARKRFSGIIADVVFDHLLIHHWQRFSEQPFSDFIQQSHAFMRAGQPLMPAEMRRVTCLMMDQRWLESYASLNGIGAILDRMSRRIRFDNRLAGSIEEIAPAIAVYDAAFLNIFPQLRAQVTESRLETIPHPPPERNSPGC